MYVLISGRIAVQKQTGFGDRMQVVALLDPGAPLGESGLLAAQSRGASLTAVARFPFAAIVSTSIYRNYCKFPLSCGKSVTWLLGRLALRLEKSSERLAHVL